jgi:predicted ATPase
LIPLQKPKRYILTGAPGSGKTALIRQLEIDGFRVIEESATDVIALRQAQGIAEPWLNVSFIDDIVTLQKSRLNRQSNESGEIQFHDRSAICTVALARFLGYYLSPLVTSELERIKAECIYQPQVFFVRGLGQVTHTAARRISLEDAQRFEAIHEQVYAEFGFQVAIVEPASVVDRAGTIKAAVSRFAF